MRVEPRAAWERAEKEGTALLRRVTLYTAYEDAGLAEYLDGIVGRLAPGGSAVRVVVVRDPTLNAFALADGHVVVHTGVLAAVDNEAELAAVLAREIAHVSLGHAARDPGDTPSRALTPGPLSPMARAIFGGALPLATRAALTGYGDAREREADAVAVASLARAGYDPRHASRLFARLAADPDRGPVEVFRLGHPATLRERQEAIQRLVDAAPAGGGVGNHDVFQARLWPVVRENAAEDIRQGRFRLARRQLERVLASAAGDSVALVYDGDLHRLQSQRAASPQIRDAESRQAEIRYLLLIAQDPALADPHRQLGLLYYQRGDVARARAELEQYLALAPDAPDAKRVAEYIRELGR